MGKKKTSNIITTAELPEDVIVELLSRLPAKSLYRFKCVSKLWLKLISSSGPGSVKDLHRKRKNNNNYYYLPLMWIWVDDNYNINKNKNEEDEDEYIYKKRMPIRNFSSLMAFEIGAQKLEEIKNLRLDSRSDSRYANTSFASRHITCCNGLLCFSPSPDDDKIHIWNPCTREFLHLPVSPNYERPRSIYDNNINNIFGFGYILPPMNQYKVVSWAMKKVIGGGDDGGSMMSCCLYTLISDNDDYISGTGNSDNISNEGGFWRAPVGRNNHYYRRYIGLDKENVCVGGVIYWRDRYSRGVLAFDLTKEESKIIEVPRGRTTNLMELKGSLCLGQINRRGELSTWTLVYDEDKWVPAFTICHPSISISNSCGVLLLYVRPRPRPRPRQSQNKKNKRQQEQEQEQEHEHEEQECLAFWSCDKIYYYDINAGTVRRLSTHLPGSDIEYGLLRPCASYIHTPFRLHGK